MNAVGIDVSKEKSMVAIMRPCGGVMASPFEVAHTDSELGKLASLLLSLNGETKVIMEYTGTYYKPIGPYAPRSGTFYQCSPRKFSAASTISIQN